MEVIETIPNCGKISQERVVLQMLNDGKRSRKKHIEKLGAVLKSFPKPCHKSPNK